MMGLDSLITILDNMRKEKEAESEHLSEEEKRQNCADIRLDMERQLLTISTGSEDKVVEWVEQMYMNQRDMVDAWNRGMRG